MSNVLRTLRDVEAEPFVALVVPLVSRVVDLRAARQRGQDGLAPVRVRDEVVCHLERARLDVARTLAVVSRDVVRDAIHAL